MIENVNCRLNLSLSHAKKAEGNFMHVNASLGNGSLLRIKNKKKSW